MTRLQRLRRRADRLGLRVYYLPMRRLSAISTPDGTIGMDPDKQESQACELVRLAHEMGHCMTGSFYTLDSDLCQRRRCEERADRWAIRSLVPLDELKRELRRGRTRPDELAEHFGVSEEFLRKCVVYYRDAKGVL